MIKDEIIEIIGKGDLKSAFILMQDYFEKNKETNQIKNTIIALSARFQKLERDQRLRIISAENIIIEKNKIENALLALLDGSEFEKEQSRDYRHKTKIFISYNHQDKFYKDELLKYLNFGLERNGNIEVWNDSELLAGSEFEKDIKRNLENSDIILLLISANYLASDYNYKQMYNALERHYNNESIIIIPILVKPCDWQNSPFSKFQILPTKNKPIINFKNIDEAYFNIITELRKVIEYKFKITEDIRLKIESLENQLKKGVNEIKKIEITEALIENYNKIYREDKVKELSVKRDKLKFNFNIKNPITIDELLIEGVSIFDEISWDLQPNVNLLLGRNGFGKTHLLRLIPCLLRNEKKIMDIDFKLYDYSLLKLSVYQNEELKRTHYNDCQFVESIGTVPMLAIPAIRNVQPSREISPVKDALSGELSEIGATYFIKEYPFDKLLQDILFVFGNDILKLERKLGDIKSAIKNFPLSNLITDIIGELTNNYFEIKNVKEYYGQSNIDIQVATEGNNELIPLQKVSQGTLSIISIIILIYYYLKSLYPEIEDTSLLSQKGIILIDEVDAHLHPKWQQKIVGILRNNFPNIQFLLTAHSPLLVAGCFEREVSVLNKINGNNKFALTQFHDNFIGKEVQEIYDTVFEIEDVDMDETYLEYLTKLSATKETDIENRINHLSKKPKLSFKEDKELQELYRLNQISEIRDKREYLENEEVENLKAKIRLLERQLKENNAR